MIINLLTDIWSEVAEGPLWNASKNTITWVDITGKKWHQISLNGGLTITRQVPTMVGAIVERSNGGYLVAVEEGFGEASTIVDGYEVTHDFLPLSARMNDAKADAKGRWWAGSNAIDFTAGEGKVHRLALDGSVDTVIEGLTLPNGMGWSPDGRFYYLIDTFARCIYRYLFDIDMGEISERSIFVEFEDDGSYPDGMCVASDGTLLVAMWSGSRIEVIGADGTFLRSIAMPVKSPTSCAFGGEKGDVLIVTSDGRDFDRDLHPDSGKLFSVTGHGFTGVESSKYNA